MNGVTVVSGNAEVCDLVATAAAAMGQQATVCAPDALEAGWHEASTLFIGTDAAAEVAALQLPHRDRVYLVGRDVAAAALWSMPLRAEVIVLPEGRAWLSSVLSGTHAVGAGRITAVLGGSGGVGASTLAAALAWRAARSGASVALVDADRCGGGIDLLIGAEQVPGWRWPRFAAAEGVLGDVREFLPVIDGVALLSMSRGHDLDLSREAFNAVLGSLQRSFDHIVIDTGRGSGPAAREALHLADRVLLVVGGSVRGLAAAGQTLGACEPARCQVVVRQLPSARVPDSVVDEALGLPVVARIRHQSRLVVAAERGDRPALGVRRTSLGRVCDQLMGAA